MNSTLLQLLAAASLAVSAFPTAASEAAQGHRQALERLVESYRTDPMAIDADFGILIDEAWWHVTARRTQESYPAGKGQYTFHNYGPHEVSLHEGAPPEPTWYFRFADDATFEKVSSGEWSAGTASARSTAADVVALDILRQDGFVQTPGVSARQSTVMEHFWKADPAEITRFSRDRSLPTHGVQFVSLYSMKDKRIGWFSIGPQEVANDDRGLDKSQVPNLFIVTAGVGEVEMDHGRMPLEAGMSFFVGPYVKHVIRNKGTTPLEGIIVLFGDNIDYAKGQSYLDFLDAQFEFHADFGRDSRPSVARAD